MGVCLSIDWHLQTQRVTAAPQRSRESGSLGPSMASSPMASRTSWAWDHVMEGAAALTGKIPWEERLEEVKAAFLFLDGIADEE